MDDPLKDSEYGTGENPCPLDFCNETWSKTLVDKLLTLFIMCELLINSKLATAGPGHFELQNYPLEEYCMKNSCFTQDLNLGPLKLLLEVY